MEFDSRVFLFGAVFGTVLMVCSFIAYVLDPTKTYQIAFVLGLALLVAGYIIFSVENRKEYRAYEVASDTPDGGVVVLDEDYTPYEDQASIEDLRDQ